MSKRLTQEVVLVRFKEAHGDRYTYDSVNYTNSNGIVDIICKVHGVFHQLAGVHKSGHGCDECAIEKNANLKRKEESVFIQEAIEMHGDKYIYDNVNYIRIMDKVNITCPIHGSFSQQAHSHLQGHGCDDCAEYSFKKDKPAILYYILDIISNLYKLGITNRTVKERFGYMMKDIKIIQTWSFDLGKNAYDTEQALHKHFKEFKQLNENFDIIGGKTEFFSKDILNLDTV